MTVEVQDPFNTYTAAPGATVFPYTFKIVSAADLIATIDDIVIDLGIDYSLSGIGSNDGGDLTLSVPLTGGQEVLVKRQMTFDRETDYQQNGDFNAPVVNNDFDRLWLALQQLGQDLLRSIKVPFTETTDQTLNVSSASRANKALVFDASGNITTSNDDYNDQAAAAAASAAAAAASQNASAANATQTGLDRIAADASAAAAAASAASVDPSNLVHISGTETITGIKNIPTAAVDTSSPQAASTAFVLGQASAVAPSNAAAAAAVGNSLRYARANHVHQFPDQLSTASGAAPSFACRAWVNFNGQGTVAIRSSGNVSSITDNGVADYTINFAAAMPDINFATVGMSDVDGSGQALMCRSTAANTTTSVRVLTYFPSVGGQDHAHNSLAVFR